MQHRQVLCRQVYANRSLTVQPYRCQHLEKPDTASTCQLKICSEWQIRTDWTSVRGGRPALELPCKAYGRPPASPLPDPMWGNPGFSRRTLPAVSWKDFSATHSKCWLPDRLEGRLSIRLTHGRRVHTGFLSPVSWWGEDP